MTKITVALFATAAAATMLAVPLSSQEIVVSARSDQAFVQEVSKDLDTELRRMRIDHRWTPSGIVKVRFQAGADGRPAAMETYESSGSKRLDRRVQDAVGRIDSLLPLPASAGPDPIIQANVIVAAGRTSRESLERKLAESEARRLASKDPEERAVLALNMAPSPSS
ncbi:energy transducer TonB [Qipengyuania seohaensis]|uniref:energy transducer TonB n=1 Tax=Qipengyuania seohaensis TaxID=266951 RepID=UPI0012FDA6AF|nr:hypothetical protein [Qipengyuania seohaensis]